MATTAERVTGRVSERLAVPIRRARAISNPPPLKRAPEPNEAGYDPYLAKLASKIIYRSGHDASGNPLLIMSAAAFPDAREINYNELLPYVLAVIPAENELGDESLGGGGYSLVFFAGGGREEKGDSKSRPQWSWTLQAYHLLGRAVKKRIKKLWVVHERAWVRIMFEMLSGVVSQKFRKKIVHVPNLSELGTYLDITRLNIPPQVYLHDRKITDCIRLPAFPPLAQFNQPPFPPNSPEDHPLPYVLTDTARYIRLHCLDVEGLFRVPPNIQLLEIVREAYDRRQFLMLADYGPHIAAGLIKLYYRALPHPLFPVSCYPDIQKFADAPEGTDLTELARDILDNKLPRSSRRLLLRHLVPLMALVASHVENNRMTVPNLAICFGPSLVRSDDVKADAQIARNGIAKFLQHSVENIEQFTIRMQDRPKVNTETKPTMMVKRSPASAANSRKTSYPPIVRTDSANNTDNNSLTTTISNTSTSSVSGKLIDFEDDHDSAVSVTSIPTTVASSQYSNQLIDVSIPPVSVPPTIPHTSASGMPSPPPSPSQDDDETSNQQQQSQQQQQQQQQQLSSSPVIAPSSPPQPSANEPAPGGTRTLMRAATTPVPAPKFPPRYNPGVSPPTRVPSGTIREQSPSPRPKTLRSQSEAPPGGAAPGKVKVSAGAVNALKALFEERAKEAEILARSASVSGRPNR